MHKENIIKLIGYASGVAANNVDCALGPWYMFYHPNIFLEHNLAVEWEDIVSVTSSNRGIDVLDSVYDAVIRIGQLILPMAQNREKFCVMGGDHSCAIGTWNAVANANRNNGDIGLIWIDAHMDSHTLATSETKNIHGMPLAHLLGEGDERFVNIFDKMPALKPENVCLIGTRSYESGEKETLDRLKVRYFGMDEIRTLGLENVMKIAYDIVRKSTCGFGISLDLDGVDPTDAPGVGCPAPDGLSGRDLVKSLKSVIKARDLLGLEIVEYNPITDLDRKTICLAMELFDAIYG